MSDNGCHHAWNSSNCLEIDCPVENLVGCNFSIPAGAPVEDTTNGLDRAKGQTIREGFGGRVRQLDVPVHVAMTLVEEIFIATAAETQWVPSLVVFHVATHFPLHDAVNGLDELVKRDATPRLSGVKEFTNLDNLVFGKGIVVLAE